MAFFADPRHPDVLFSHSDLPVPHDGYDHFHSHLNNKAQLESMGPPIMNTTGPLEYSLAKLDTSVTPNRPISTITPICIATSVVLGPPPKECPDEHQLSSDEEQSGGSSMTASLSTSAPLGAREPSNVEKTKAYDVDVQAAEKRRRTSVACDACRHRKARCSGGVRCELCIRDEIRCVYDRHPRTRYVPLKTPSKTSSVNKTRQKLFDTSSEPIGGVELAATDPPQNVLPTPEMSRIPTVSPTTSVGTIMLQSEPPAIHVRELTENHGLAYWYWQEIQRQDAIFQWPLHLQLQSSVENGREADQTFGAPPGLVTPNSNGASLSEEEEAVIGYLVDDEQ